MTEVRVLVCQLDQYVAGAVVREADGGFVVDQCTSEEVEARGSITFFRADGAENLEGVAKPICLSVFCQ